MLFSRVYIPIKINLNHALLDPVFLFIMFTDPVVRYSILSFKSKHIVGQYFYVPCVILGLQSEPCWAPAWHSVAFGVVTVLVLHFVAMGKCPRKVT